MTEFCRASLFKRAAWVGVLGLALVALGAGTGVRAQEASDEEESIWNFDQRLIGDFLANLGLRSGYEREIDYRERSPLVLPPSRNLPPPQTANAARNPAWPVDPDVKRRTAAAAKRQKNVGYDPDEAAKNLTPSELERGRDPNARNSGSADPNVNRKDNMSPSELGYMGGMFSWTGFGFGWSRTEVGTFTAEPPRSNLTAPPSGYQTPSPAQPYGVTKTADPSPPRDSNVPLR
jgi:hypothetical protein